MKNMKLSMLLSVNDQSEEEMCDRFEKLIDSLSKEQEKILFQGDCCLVSLNVDELESHE